MTSGTGLERVRTGRATCRRETSAARAGSWAATAALAASIADCRDVTGRQVVQRCRGGTNAIARRVVIEGCRTIPNAIARRVSVERVSPEADAVVVAVSVVRIFIVGAERVVAQSEVDARPLLPLRHRPRSGCPAKFAHNRHTRCRRIRWSRRYGYRAFRRRDRHL